ncbi:MAG: hypothetical protein AB8B91_07475 [Rubripirellula sp.]
MIKLLPTARLLIALALVLQANQAPAQSPGRSSRIQAERAVTRSRIGDQRVQRQTEDLRLEEMIDRMGARLMRIERNMLSSSRFPSITISESEAGLVFARAQLKAQESHQEVGEDRELNLARLRLAVAQAEGQLEVAKAANAESLLLLELDVLQAERRLALATRETQQLERLVARGYANSDGLEMKLLDKSVAEKEVQLARLRLQTQKKLNPEENRSEPVKDESEEKKPVAP